MIQHWAFTPFPTEKDPTRYKLKLYATEEDLGTLMRELGSNCGRPFVPVSKDFNWALYVYNVTEAEMKRVEKLLESKSVPGAKMETAEAGEQEGATLESLLEKVVTQVEDAPPARVAAGKATGSTGAGRAAQVAAPAATRLNPHYTFEEFVVGPNNRFTHAAAQAVADNPGKVYNPLFIYGGVGLGKTHLMEAVGHILLEKNPSARILYVTTERFISEVISAVSGGALNEFRARYRELDLIMVDDIQFLADAESTQEEFFHTFNVLHDAQKQIIITSDRPPKKLELIEERLKSRFEWGLIADVKPPNLETRVAILKKKWERDHGPLDENVLLYIAGKLKSNIRELEGFLKRIDAYSQITGQDMNMEMVKGLMQDLLPEEEGEPVPPAAPVPPPPVSRPKIEVRQAAPPAAPAAPAPPAAPPAPAAKPVPPPVPVVAAKAEPPFAPVAKPPAPLSAPPSPAVAGAVAGLVQNPPAGEEEMEASLKPVPVVYFFPSKRQKELIRVKEQFRDAIKKHKLKFRLVGLADYEYDPDAKVNYAGFAKVCLANNRALGVALGPPPGVHVTEEDFGSMLAALFEDEKIPFQLIAFAELHKPYKYLNVALDITLTVLKGA